MTNPKATPSKATGKCTRTQGPLKRVKIDRDGNIPPCSQCGAASRVYSSRVEENPFPGEPGDKRRIQYRKCLRGDYTWITWFTF